MEKLAGSLGISVLTSAGATSKLSSFIPLKPAGSYELKGFDARYDFFQC
jgi:hypothetical protein